MFRPRRPARKRDRGERLPRRRAETGVRGTSAGKLNLRDVRMSEIERAGAETEEQAVTRAAAARPAGRGFRYRTRRAESRGGRSGKRNGCWVRSVPLRRDLSEPQAGGAQVPYENLYCARGDMENRIREQLPVRRSDADRDPAGQRLGFAAFAGGRALQSRRRRRRQDAGRNASDEVPRSNHPRPQGLDNTYPERNRSSGANSRAAAPT